MLELSDVLSNTLTTMSELRHLDVRSLCAIPWRKSLLHSNFYCTLFCNLTITNLRVTLLVYAPPYPSCPIQFKLSKLQLPQFKYFIPFKGLYLMLSIKEGIHTLFAIKVWHVYPDVSINLMICRNKWSHLLVYLLLLGMCHLTLHSKWCILKGNLNLLTWTKYRVRWTHYLFWLSSHWFDDRHELFKLCIYLSLKTCRFNINCATLIWWLEFHLHARPQYWIMYS